MQYRSPWQSGNPVQLSSPLFTDSRAIGRNWLHSMAYQLKIEVLHLTLCKKLTTAIGGRADHDVK